MTRGAFRIDPGRRPERSPRRLATEDFKIERAHLKLRRGTPAPHRTAVDRLSSIMIYASAVLTGRAAIGGSYLRQASSQRQARNAPRCVLPDVPNPRPPLPSYWTSSMMPALTAIAIASNPSVAHRPHNNVRARQDRWRSVGRIGWKSMRGRYLWGPGAYEGFAHSAAPCG